MFGAPECLPVFDDAWTFTTASVVQDINEKTLVWIV
jgi:hypothetical protein